MPTFEEVVACVRGERAYQDERWKRPAHNHSLTEYLVYIDHYVKNAMAIVSKEDGDKGSLDDFRKIAALAFAAMEENGLEPRKIGSISDYSDFTQIIPDLKIETSEDGRHTDVSVAQGVMNEIIGGWHSYPEHAIATPAEGKIEIITHEEGIRNALLAEAKLERGLVNFEKLLNVWEEILNIAERLTGIQPENLDLRSRPFFVDRFYATVEEIERMYPQPKDAGSVDIVKSVQDAWKPNTCYGQDGDVFNTARASNEIMDARKQNVVEDPEKIEPDEWKPYVKWDGGIQPEGWISYRIRWDLMGKFLGIDTYKQSTRAIVRTPSPRYVIHKCAACPVYFFFYDERNGELPDQIADHYLDKHPLICELALDGMLPLNTKITTLVQEF